MHYCITVQDNIITGVHQSTVPYTDDTFAASPTYAGQEVRPLDDPKEYATGLDMREYNEDGTLRPIVERIKEGYQQVPEGYELVGDELVAVDKPPEEQEQAPTVKAQLEKLSAENAALLEAKTLQDAQVRALIEQNEMFGDLIQELALQAYS